jgi:hypothetical protein
MASIRPKPQLKIDHDKTNKTVRAVVKARINFTQYEMSQMQQGLRFKLRCQLWGQDNSSDAPLDPADDPLYVLEDVKYYPDATPAVTEDAVFDVTLGEGVLDEDFGLSRFEIDEIYAKLILINEFTGGKVRRKTNVVEGIF